MNFKSNDYIDAPGCSRHMSEDVQESDVMKGMNQSIDQSARGRVSCFQSNLSHIVPIFRLHTLPDTDFTTSGTNGSSFKDSP